MALLPMAWRSPRRTPHDCRLERLATAACLCLSSALAAWAALPADMRRPIEALPPHVAGLFRDAAGFEQRASGDYLVFDARGHAVFRVDASRQHAQEFVHIGGEEGRVLQPVAFDVAADGSFAVADTPFGRQRVQVFSPAGVEAFRVCAARTGAGAAQGNDGLVLNGVGSLSYDGTRVYANQPETGALVTVYSIPGQAERSFGGLRATGYEASIPRSAPRAEHGICRSPPQTAATTSSSRRASRDFANTMRRARSFRARDSGARD